MTVVFLALTTMEIINTLAQVGSFLVVLMAAVAAIVQLRHLRASNELEALLTLTDQLRLPDLQQAFKFVQIDLADRLGEPAYRAELARIGYIDSSAHPEMEVCNWFNEVGTLVKNGLIDESTFLDLFARLVTYYWMLLEPVIALLRRQRGAGQYENFEYLAQLAHVWKQRHPSGSYPRRTPRLPIRDPWLAADGEAQAP